jgi:hypothetical protein
MWLSLLFRLRWRHLRRVSKRETLFAVDRYYRSGQERQPADEVAAWCPALGTGQPGPLPHRIQDKPAGAGPGRLLAGVPGWGIAGFASGR